jgi:dTDP-4-amino-4,6-dideoxygalactose transaminase
MIEGVDDFLVFGAPVLDDQDVAATTRPLRTGWIGPGPEVEAFQHEFAAFVEASGAVAVTSCTAALHLALLALDLGPGDEVITTPLTFPATANAIIHAGGTPVFADVRRDGNIDPDRVEERVGARTRAVIPVHYAGLPCDIERLQILADHHRIALVSDAAHAIEARWCGRGLGSYGTAAYSFYATKNLATGEGGMLTSTDRDLLSRAALLSRHGVSRNAWARFGGGNLGGYQVVEPGLNYALPDILASLGRSQLRRIRERHRRRTEIAARYDALLLGGPVLTPPIGPPHATHARHLYPVLAEDRAARDYLRRYLLDQGIGTGVHFEPVHLQSWYRRRFGYGRGDFPMAEDLGERTLSLPLSPGLQDGDVERVAKAVLSA